MSRAWPFEDVPEGGRVLRTPEEFVKNRGEGSEAVIVRIGLHDAQLVLVDARGAWQRWVYHSVEEAQSIAGALAVPVHVGEYPEEMRVRINGYQRPAADFDRGAYPEQGRVGPVSGYNENRIRRRLPARSKKENG
ncbi:MAG TPA: hypothetical protein VNC78_05885 [Actinomycetota bacterium]|nr:hypothetical protein [Actinomycetota bacterium]